MSELHVCTLNKITLYDSASAESKRKKICLLIKLMTEKRASYLTSASQHLTMQAKLHLFCQIQTWY